MISKNKIFCSFIYLFIHFLSIYLIFIRDNKCIPTLMLRVARLPQILYHTTNICSIQQCMRQNQGSILVLYGLDTKAPYLFCSHINWYFYKKWKRKGMESLWFELRLFPIKCWGQHFYFIGTSKQSNVKINSCFIRNYLEIPFVSMKRTLSIRLSHEADKNCICIYICRIESVVSLFENIAAAYSKQFMGFVYKYS